ncbi:MAG: lipopolysaccharide biosynthesis protein [Deltaproteobacteria bacterium]|nr:lipopolysaccharide biosynthesis protein [Deltaproteobacteria bacterium]
MTGVGNEPGPESGAETGTEVETGRTDGAGMAKRVARGVGWLYTYRWLERLLDLLSIIVLARILSPEDFGIVAIAVSIVAIVEGLSAFDVNKALIRTRCEDRDLYDSAWTLSALRGLASALCMIVIAPFLSDPRLAAVLAVLALSPVLMGLSNPRFVLFERDLIYSKLAVLTLGARGVSFGLTLGLAFVYRSYWALVIGMVAGHLTSLVLSYALRPYRPRLTLARFSDIFAFSGWLSLTTMVTTLAMETDKLIVGKWLGVADAGRYFMTQRVGVLPTRELVSPLQRILFPSFSELTADTGRLRRVVGESINVIGSLSLPAGFGFALVAGDFVPLALGPQWDGIIPLLQILVPYLSLRATLSMTLPCVMALGQVRLLFWVSLAYSLFHVPAFIAATAFYGLPGAIWSLVVAGVLYSYLNAWLLNRTLSISLSEILAQLLRPLCASALMVGAVLALGAVLPPSLLSEPASSGFAASATSWWRLLAQVGVGGVVFCSTLYALWRWQGRPAGIEQRLLQLRSR